MLIQINKNTAATKLDLILAQNFLVINNNVIVFGVDMSSFVHIGNKKKHILILSIGPGQGLDNTIITAEAEYSINFSRSCRKFCLSLLYNGSNSF